MSASPTVAPGIPSKESPTNLADLLLRAVQLHADSRVYVASRDGLDTEFMTYSVILEEARRILGGLQACGLSPQSKVALLLSQPRDFIPVFWACILGGYVPCPLARTGSDTPRWAGH